MSSNVIFVLNTLVVIGIVVSAWMAVRFEKVLSSIIALAIAGAFMALEFILLQAPDVAIAEAAVGAVLTTVLFVITLRKTKEDDDKNDKA